MFKLEYKNSRIRADVVFQGIWIPADARLLTSFIFFFAVPAWPAAVQP